MASVFFYVQHLLGIGHLRRSIAIANRLAHNNVSVHLASGGRPVPNAGLHDDVTFTQLPPVSARDANFSDLVDERGQPIDASWWQHRCECLLSAWRDSGAPLLLTESYPFARRMMRHELLPLLEASRSHSFSKINVCSVRDIPQPKRKAKRFTEVSDILTQYYDQVLVHGDKRIATLDETFPNVVTADHPPISYTGYVDTDSSDIHAASTTSDVLVSAGGGAAGLHVYKAALAAAQSDSRCLWRLLIGPNISVSEYQSLQASRSANVVVERNRPDFRALLKASEVSVSQAGYNTMVDVLRTGAAAVLIPYAKGGEQEQNIRAHRFAASGAAVLLGELSLNAASLLDAVAQARQLKTSAGTAVDLDTDGAERSAQLIKYWLESL
jgi:predicted glycosyltransferase